MTGTTPFSPVLPTVQLASATSSTSVLTGAKARTSQTDSPTPQGAPTFPGGYTVQVTNAGAATVQLVFGSGSATATSASGIMMLANTTRVFSVGESVDTVAQIASATGSKLYITPGNGGV